MFACAFAVQWHYLYGLEEGILKRNPLRNGKKIVVLPNKEK